MRVLDTASDSLSFNDFRLFPACYKPSKLVELSWMAHLVKAPNPLNTSKTYRDWLCIAEDLVNHVVLDVLVVETPQFRVRTFKLWKH